MNEDATRQRTLGTALRHLLELLDGDVQAVYREEGLDYRPRYTPLMRALAQSRPLAIKALAAAAGISHSAASQTIAKMRAAGLVVDAQAEDGRERTVKLSRRGSALLPRLRERWAATNTAAEQLDHELSQRLSACVEEAIAALEAKPFKERIRAVEKHGRRSKS